ncbi:DUF317 domain-containing protein [Streptomyces sp. H27-H1]|uniref:DUF317 domain-containing protein n=1 Tax=Streptomyces sp. H27-H1 TaxID=2996461 RepID=UPI00226FEC47|nr:DUF317 domain-containing protein [Streptomyces sp. H27-H1]MCY0928204.1 DUF317 domain-containing protein [Streptomyces sp. H27-H1]
MNEDLRAFAEDMKGQFHCEVTPRHLAGAGDPRHITHALRAAGWRHEGDRGLPQVSLTSPDRSLSLLLDLSSPYHAWSVGSTQIFAPGYWQAGFASSTPVEIIAGLTDSLIRPAPAHAPPDVWESLASAGWDISDEPLGREASPPGSQGLKIKQLGGGDRDDDYFWWQVQAVAESYGGNFETVWSASLDQTTPPHVLAGLIEQLGSPAGVRRGSHEPGVHYRATHGDMVAVGPQIVADHTVRMDAARAGARALTRAAKLPTSRPHQPAPTTNAAAPRR